MDKTRLTMCDPAYYRIEIQGMLPDSWKVHVGGMQIQVRIEDSGRAVTALMGNVVDQAALMGILNLVYDLGMPLLSLECLEHA